MPRPEEIIPCNCPESEAGPVSPALLMDDVIENLGSVTHFHYGHPAASVSIIHWLLLLIPLPQHRRSRRKIVHSVHHCFLLIPD